MKSEIDEGVAKKIYAILVKYAGADPKDEEDFVWRVVDGCVEYRFCGALGVGGKFYSSTNVWWVKGYKEDQTPKSLKMAERTNDKLKLLRGSLDPLGSLAITLCRRYDRKYPGRRIAIDAETGSYSPRLYIVFCYSNEPYKVYMQIVFRDSVRVAKRVEPNYSVFKEVGVIQYEDPQMIEKLNRLVDRIVTTTPMIKEEPAET